MAMAQKKGLLPKKILKTFLVNGKNMNTSRGPQAGNTVWAKPKPRCLLSLYRLLEPLQFHEVQGPDEPLPSDMGRSHVLSQWRRLRKAASLDAVVWNPGL